MVHPDRLEIIDLRAYAVERSRKQRENKEIASIVARETSRTETLVRRIGSHLVVGTLVVAASIAERILRP